ncbi:MAG: type I methionyl aminopeptidase [Pseudomonadota bacterium]
MRAAGRLAARALTFIAPYIKPGITTAELDRLCESFIRDHGAIPAPLGYKGYPKATCISLNHVVCHGIPDEKKLRDGDILNIDITVILEGWYGDTSKMFTVGDKVSIKAKRLIEATERALMIGIEQVKPGHHVGDIGHAIETFIATQNFSVVHDFCGHGLGRVFHGPPNIPHFGKPGTGPMFEPGMFFTIEPMVNAGKPGVKVLHDGWTAVTKDHSLSAQCEHSVGVSEDGVEIFTLDPPA